MCAKLVAFVLALVFGLCSAMAAETKKGSAKEEAKEKETPKAKEKTPKQGEKSTTPSETASEAGATSAGTETAGIEAPGTEAEGTPAPASGESVAEGSLTPETSLDACQDAKDNDGDGHTDCADEECQIYAICVVASEGPLDSPTPTEVEPLQEKGHQCRDKQDNDGDGLVDCHDPTCERYFYCRKLMYEVPAPPDKPQALYISMGAGIALSNYHTPTAETARFSPYNRKIPFDPDIGVTAGMKIGYFFLKWLGVGANFNVTGTGATNRLRGFRTRDDSDLYRYYGTKVAGHVGGFVRFQWPFGRFVPFLDAAVGYSVAKYTWNVYDPDTSWSDIADRDGDDDWLSGQDPSIEYELTSRHFTFALEPGFDLFVVKRVFAIGARGWLPVVASNEPRTDNVGILLHLTVTPLWREPKRLKAEYQKPETK